MAKPKCREIKIQSNGKFNTNGTVHDTIESAFKYWDKKLPNESVTHLLYPKMGALEMGIACSNLDYAKKCLGVV